MVDTNPESILPTNIKPTKSIEPGEEKQPQPEQSFESYMKPGQEGEQGGVKSGQITPFELATQSANIQNTTPTMDSLVSQMNSTSSVLGDLQNQLNTKNLKLKQSQKYLLRNKLSSANDNIRSASDKTGVDVGPTPSSNTRQNPITRFLSLVTDSQTQLNQAQNMINGMKANGKMINPGDMLLIQIKLAKAQQELEYSSVLLSKAVDDIKTMFNIQV